eukprot:3435230-Karenia_brevis.AAC.1
MRRSTPRCFWAVYRAHTTQAQRSIQISPDTQWEHWANQGHITEPVWTSGVLDDATDFVNWLRTRPSLDCELQATT